MAGAHGRVGLAQVGAQVISRHEVPMIRNTAPHRVEQRVGEVPPYAWLICRGLQSIRLTDNAHQSRGAARDIGQDSVLDTWRGHVAHERPHAGGVLLHLGHHEPVRGLTLCKRERPRNEVCAATPPDIRLGALVAVDERAELELESPADSRRQHVADAVEDLDGHGGVGDIAHLGLAHKAIGIAVGPGVAEHQAEIAVDLFEHHAVAVHALVQRVRSDTGLLGASRTAPTASSCRRGSHAPG